jgi:hypothetical protein
MTDRKPLRSLELRAIEGIQVGLFSSSLSVNCLFIGKKIVILICPFIEKNVTCDLKIVICDLSFQKNLFLVICDYLKVEEEGWR